MPDAAARLGAAVSANEVWAGLLVEELVRQGVALFCLAPGSRSTPLALAVLRHPRAAHLVHFDERGTAFAALGHARATGRPAAWITTSGTAVANGVPAAAEADADGVPLLLLTADRPPELRATGANQTIRQPPLFADLARWTFDVPPPSAEVDARFVLTTAAQAAYRATATPGPVHLNLMFREPLAPAPDGTDVRALLAPLEGYLAGAAPFTRYAPPPAQPDVRALAEALAGRTRGLVVLGPTDDPAAAPAAAALAARLGWPFLPDVLSQGRTASASEGETARVPFYDLLLGSAAFRRAHAPEAVLLLGRRPTSKRLAQFLEAAAPACLAVVRADAARFDPAHRVTLRVQGDPAAAARALAEALPGTSDSPPAWLRAWKDASARVGDVLERALGAEGEALSEPFVARAVARLAPEGHGLVAAASMPVRDLDAFAAADGPRLRLTANRGASGIDGTVATAHGFARGLGRPVTLLTGDLALLHDLNSLALLREGPPVVVVVVNNDGGGIFHFLPAAEALPPEHFEPAFGAPHGLGFEDAARMFGLDYARPETPSAFAEAYRAACASGRAAVLEVRTERHANRVLHRDLLARAVAAAEG
ncbi:MAG: 2-succinyl-5-enolpyruvyl-6-hydroxy-3-cyclohexene-1-carboxylic-acid synthase [Rubricoccaceae bacterium]